MGPASDAEVIRAVLHGDVERYAELVEKYQGTALRLAFSFLRNYEDARDVSQEAFVSAYRALGRFRAASTFSTWLYRIVINACKDAFKRRARQPVAASGLSGPDPDEAAGDGLFVDVADPGAGPGDQAASRETAVALRAEIQALPEQQRTAFLLHHVHGLPLEEAAGVMGCRVGTVKAHVFRATERLRGRLARWLSEEEAT